MQRGRRGADVRSLRHGLRTCIWNIHTGAGRAFQLTPPQEGAEYVLVWDKLYEFGSHELLGIHSRNV